MLSGSRKDSVWYSFFGQENIVYTYTLTSPVPTLSCWQSIHSSASCFLLLPLCVLRLPLHSILLYSMEDFAPLSSPFPSSTNGDGRGPNTLSNLAAELPSTSATQSSTQPLNLSDPTPARPYDVFLNHRGPDVKKSLASCIYHWLEDKGLRVFLDKEELQAGEGLHPTIQHAIDSASVHVAIFSKRYAESSWCLEELCSMLKSGAKIIPLFYDVRPCELRWVGEGKGVYVSAFDQHQKKRRVPPQKLTEWKAALRGVSNLHGLELNGPEFNGDLGKLLRSIANTVLEAVAEKVPLECVKDPVGLDEALEDFHNFIDCEEQHKQQEPVKIVGIVGFGGSGKTTLAKQFYNIRRPSFTASSFLFDVRHQKLQSLQSKLLNDLLHISDSKIGRLSASEGTAILRHKLRSSNPRVLVILDDIDHERQIEDLLPKEALGSGSLVLLTCRDEVALRKSGADSIYKIKPLKSNHSLELFCRHAFQQPLPKRGFEDLAKKFSEKCRGFPLFLKVMGAHLRVIGSDDKDVWHDELEYIPDGIKNLLRISYDALSTEEKQMFLDVACFLLGEHKSMAIRVWNGLDKRASIRLQNLERKCLVEVDDKNCLTMHDQLREFGRGIAKQESPCRFWHPSQIINIREQLRGIRDVRGIIAATGKFSHELRLSSVFEEIELSRLRFLAVKGDCFESRFEQGATNLLWLRWYDCPHTNIPSPLISVKNLTVLHIIGGILEKWEVFATQLPLKELLIQETKLSHLSISEDICPQLEHLDLSDNRRLVEVEHLPTTLLLLNLSLCKTLSRISTNFHLEKLKLLNINGCCGLTELPDLKHLTSLETLQASGCSKLKNIRGLELLSKLQELSVHRCSELEKLPDLSGLTSLERLVTWGCGKLQNIQGLEHLSKLRYLSIQCSESGELPNLSGLTSLETLQTAGSQKLKNICGLEHLSKLQELSVSHCSELDELPDLSGLISLETLTIWGCDKLQNIAGLEHLSKLRYLNIQCSELGELPNLSGLTSLETLHTTRSRKLKNICGLEHLLKLQELSVCHCFEFDELPDLSDLISLQTLTTWGCSKLQNIRGLEHLSKLRYLNVDQCSELGELPNLSELTSLEMLQTSGCSKLKSIDGLEYLSKLRYLIVDQCSQLDELPNLSGLTSLETLQASHCSKLKNIGGLERLSKLRYLCVDHCYELRELPNLSGLTSLETLVASNCNKLQILQGLEHLPNLRSLRIDHCFQLGNLQNLMYLPSLRMFRA